METYRIQPDASVYYTTFTVVDWLPVFVSETACQIVTNSLEFCQKKMGLRVNAYVIMPTHMHAIFFEQHHDASHLNEIMTAFRKHTGKALADFCGKHLPPCFLSTMCEAAESDRTRRFWQPSKHPVALTSEHFWEQKLKYLHDNPRRKGLVLYPEHWRFSSARYYAEGRDAFGDVEITQIEWH